MEDTRGDREKHENASDQRRLDGHDPAFVTSA